MLTYTLSGREKALLLVLVVVLLAAAWFALVFQRTTEQVNDLENRIAVAEADATVASAQVKRMHAMQAVVDEYKSAGIAARQVPDFDNMTPLMTELNGIMGMASTYTLSFDDLDAETSDDYILRGVTANYGCDSYATAEAVVSALANGTYPCSVDSVTITDNSARTTSRIIGAGGSGPVSASVHVTFFERRPSAAI